MRYCIALFLFWLATTNLAAQVYTVETVPNPKVVNNTWVSDPTGILSYDTFTLLNAKLDSLEIAATAQVAIVMLPSIGTSDIFDFSQSLFTKWGIGQPEKDNGLLILFVKDQRTIRFHTGLGLEGVLPDITCKRIQQQFMVPYFKNGEYNNGILLGVNEVIEILTSPFAKSEITEKKTLFRNSQWDFYGILATVSFIFLITFLETRKVNQFKFEVNNLKLWLPWWWWLILYFVPIVGSYILFFPVELKPIYLLNLYLFLALLMLERYIRLFFILRPHVKKMNFQEVYNCMMREKRYWKIASILFPIPMIGLYFNYLKTAQAYRDKPRNCKNCGSACHKLSEATEDEFLLPGQQTEEKVKSIDYDVWKCTTCGAFESVRYITPNTEYSTCPSCAFTTSHSIKKRTVKMATSMAEGSGEEDFNCSFCGFHRIVPFTIPRLSGSSSSDGGSSSGSFGGGSSGGGGASSNW